MSEYTDTDNELDNYEAADFDLLLEDEPAADAPPQAEAQAPAEPQADDTAEDIRALERIKARYPHLVAPQATEPKVEPKPDDPLAVNWGDPDGIERAVRAAAEQGRRSVLDDMKPIFVENATSAALQAVGVDAPEVRAEVKRMLNSLPADQLPGVVKGGLHELVAKAAIGDAALKGRFQPTARKQVGAEPVGGRRIAASSDTVRALKNYETRYGKLSDQERREFVRDYEAGE